ncbi:putative Ras GTPase-activating protein-binding protein [Helianthus annuus]|nr:putative Ras GTPase-activating protein-binding protein [Helianthus annuus]
MENYNYSAQEVANAFLQQYYRIMQRAPKDGFNFYKEQSIRSHQCADGSMKTATTLQVNKIFGQQHFLLNSTHFNMEYYPFMQGINDDIMASNIKQWNPDLTTVHAQDSVMESVFVGVLGYLTDNAGVERNFTQTFVLAPQEGGGFYVHNDFLQFLDVIMSSIASLPAWQQAPNKKAKNVSYTSLVSSFRYKSYRYSLGDFQL